MESPPGYNDGGNNTASSWSSATNWTIAGGSLNGSVTFESSIFPIDSDAVDSGEKPALLLKPPSPDCGPCEINISFAQKHEIRQVYVRSTARVYEIYFAPSVLSSNEYLCTVRCGIAARDDEVLHATYVEEPAGANSRCYAGEHVKEKCSDEGSIVSSEEDWINVKIPDSSEQDYQLKSVPENFDANQGTNSQAFYEATAEVTDADACSSLALRLLSLQNKGCLIVDEIYVFAEPVESDGSETQASQLGNSSGSSLMAMLVPTLLQLSKTGRNRVLDKHDSNARGKGDYLELGSKISDSSNIASGSQTEESIAAQQDLKLREANGATSDPPVFPVCSQVSDTRQKGEYLEVGPKTSDYVNNASEKEERAAAQQDLKLQDVHGATLEQPQFPVCGQVSEQTQVQIDAANYHIERVLEQLVSRVSKIEEICLRFEENLLRPISSIDARLQKVEQQVELLTRNSEQSGLSCARICAPDFSCNGSNSSSFYNEGSDSPACAALELGKKDAPCDKESNQPDNVSISVNYAMLLPSLVVTAPEFSCDEEENNDDLVPEDHQMDCPQEKMKQALSIDDALAAALAGFLSTTTTNAQPSEHTQILTVSAPEFATGEDDSNGKLSSPSAPSDKPISLSIFSSKSDAIDSPNGSNVVDNCSKEASEGVDGQDQLDDTLFTSINCSITQADLEVTEQKGYEVTELKSGGESSEGINFSDSERTALVKESVGNLTIDISNTLPDVDASTAKDVVEESHKDILQNVLKSSSPPHVVDFELPILDVKFDTQTSSAKSLLEALLASIPEIDNEASGLQLRDDDLIGEQSPVSLVDEGDPQHFSRDHHLLVNFDGYVMEDEALKEPFTSKQQEMFDGLI